MANKIPFTAYARVTPERGKGKRFEAIRSLERIAHLIYVDLVGHFAGNTSSPGGDGTWGLISSTDSLSQDSNIVAVKPQFGQDPDMVTIVGFYNGTGSVPYRENVLLHGGQYVSGPDGASGVRVADVPSTTSVADVKALKTALEVAVTHASMTIIKIEVAGVTYGRGGFHFPR